VLMQDPEVVTFTAKVKIVPITSRRMLTKAQAPRLLRAAWSVRCGCHRNLTRSSVQATDTGDGTSPDSDDQNLRRIMSYLPGAA